HPLLPPFPTRRSSDLRGSGSRGHPSAVGSLRHDQRPDDATMREALASRKRLTGSSGSPAESTPRRPSRLLTVATYEKRLSNGGRSEEHTSELQSRGHL